VDRPLPADCVENPVRSCSDDPFVQMDRLARLRRREHQVGEVSGTPEKVDPAAERARPSSSKAGQKCK